MFVLEPDGRCHRDSVLSGHQVETGTRNGGQVAEERFSFLGHERSLPALGHAVQLDKHPDRVGCSLHQPR